MNKNMESSDRIDDEMRFISVYSETTKNACMCTVAAMVATMVFVMSPLNDFILTSLIAKIGIIVLLGYTIYKNTVQATIFKNQFKINLVSGHIDAAKINVICSYTFSIFLSFLLMSVVKQFFV